MNIGATLKRARETRGLSGDDLARRTRIAPRLLAAMEQDDWTKLPGGIFTRGYLRAYAREVGLDGEALVQQYEAEHAPPPPPASPTEPERVLGTGEWRLVVRYPKGALSARQNWQRFAWPVFAGVVLLTLYLVSGRTAPVDDAPPLTAEIPGEATGGTASSLGSRPAAPVGTAATSEPMADIALPLPGPEIPIALDLAVTRPCWVAVTVDGVRRTYRLVQPGERERQEGREFLVRVGDAGALQISLDGEPARPIGAPGEVVTLRITRDNYRSLLAAAAAGENGRG